jgi:hypothetical protein
LPWSNILSGREFLSLAKNIPKSAVLAEVEDTGYILLFTIVAAIILGVVIDPVQTENILMGLFQSFVAPAVAFIQGLINFVYGLVQGIISMVGQAVYHTASSVGSDLSSGASWLYNHTIGALFIYPGVFP